MSIVKRLKNNTPSDKLILTRVVSPGQYYNLDYKQWVEVLDNPDLLSEINSGDIVVNNGSIDILDTTAAIKFLEKFQSDAATVLGTTFDMTFGDQGSFRNEWVELGIIGSRSDSVPNVIPFDCKLISMIFTNNNSSVDLDVELYKNGTSNNFFTWQIRNKKTAYKTNNLDSAVFAPGDTLSVYVRDRGTNANNGFLRFTFQVTSEVLGEG